MAWLLWSFRNVHGCIGVIATWQYDITLKSKGSICNRFWTLRGSTSGRPTISQSFKTPCIEINGSCSKNSSWGWSSLEVGRGCAHSLQAEYSRTLSLMDKVPLLVLEAWQLDAVHDTDLGLLSRRPSDACSKLNSCSLEVSYESKLKSGSLESRCL